MTKRERKAISNTFAMVFLITGLFLYWMVFKSNNLYIFFGIIFATPIIEGTIYTLLPKAKSNKNRKPEKQKRTPNRQSNRLREDNEIIASPLEDLSWREFERLCFLYFKAKGYKPRESGEGADGGVDLIIYNRHHQAEEAIQIKHYINSGNPITVERIRELHSAKRNHKCLLSRFITTSSFTKDALKQADDFNLVCHDLNWVKNKIVKWQVKEQENMKV